MSFTVEEFRDLVSVLKERPEWREELRRLVLTDELLSLPEEIAGLRRETERRFQKIGAQIAQLVEAQRRTEERMGRLEETVRQLAEAQRRTEERMGRLEETVGQLTEAQRRTEEQVTTLVTQVSLLTTQVVELTRVVSILTDDVGELKGKSLETDYRTKVFAYFGRLLSRTHALSPDELAALLDDAIDMKALSTTEAHEIALADVVVRGKRRQDGTEIYLVVEVSWGVGSGDVERAVHRAGLLSRAGVTTVPVVVGRRAMPEAAELARADKVWQLIDGRVVLPESDAAFL